MWCSKPQSEPIVGFVLDMGLTLICREWVIYADNRIINLATPLTK